MESGIYKITINHHLYIGSAVSLRKRKIRHLWDLRKNQHCNKKMQRAFNKYGEINLDFQVIEKVSRNELIIREQFFLDTLKPNLNLCKKAGSSIGIKHTSKTKKFLSKIRKGIPFSLGRKLSDETKKKISEKAKTRGLHPKFLEASKKANKGSKHPKELILRTSLKTAKLDKLQVNQIRSFLKEGALRQKDIAAMFGVCQKTICNIKNNNGVVYPSFT